MKHLLMILLLAIPTTYASAESYDAQQKAKKINYAQSIFRKKLQRKCGYTAGHWAQQHTQSEWNAFQANGTFKDELGAMCPKGIAVVKDKWMEPLYLFAVEYAKDADKRPRC